MRTEDRAPELELAKSEFASQGYFLDQLHSDRSRLSVAWPDARDLEMKAPKSFASSQSSQAAKRPATNRSSTATSSAWASPSSGGPSDQFHTPTLSVGSSDNDRNLGEHLLACAVEQRPSPRSISRYHGSHGGMNAIARML